MYIDVVKLLKKTSTSFHHWKTSSTSKVSERAHTDFVAHPPHILCGMT